MLGRWMSFRVGEMVTRTGGGYRIILYIFQTGSEGACLSLSDSEKSMLDW